MAVAALPVVFWFNVGNEAAEVVLVRIVLDALAAWVVMFNAAPLLVPPASKNRILSPAKSNTKSPFNPDDVPRCKRNSPPSKVPALLKTAPLAIPPVGVNKPLKDPVVADTVPPERLVAVVAVAALPEHEVEDPLMFIVWPLMNVATAAAVPERRKLSPALTITAVTPEATELSVEL